MHQPLTPSIKAKKYRTKAWTSHSSYFSLNPMEICPNNTQIAWFIVCKATLGPNPAPTQSVAKLLFISSEVGSGPSSETL